MTTAALPQPADLAARRDPRGAIVAQVEKWRAIHARHVARGERTMAARALRQIRGYEAALTTVED